MPVISDHVEIEHKPKLGGGGPGKTPHRRGFGGGDDGDHGRRPDRSSSSQRLRRARIGVTVCIFSVLVVFIWLTVIYLARQGMGPYDSMNRQGIHDWKPMVLPYRQLWINTLLLVLSSICLELAKRMMGKKAEFAVMGIVPPRSRTDMPWLGLTVLLGFGFLAGQILVWSGLRNQGIFRHANPSSSFFLGFTGLHAIHLAGGLLFLLYTTCGRWFHMRLESRLIAVDASALYWHFMGVLWFGIFALLHFAKG
jgi:cytochrome c oxidase subunit III